MKPTVSTTDLVTALKCRLLELGSFNSRPLYKSIFPPKVFNNILLMGTKN